MLPAPSVTIAFSVAAKAVSCPTRLHMGHPLNACAGSPWAGRAATRTSATHFLCITSKFPAPCHSMYPRRDTSFRCPANAQYGLLSLVLPSRPEVRIIHFFGTTGVSVEHHFPLPGHQHGGFR